MKTLALTLLCLFVLVLPAAGNPAPPSVDVKVNGGESGVQIQSGTPVKIDCSVQAGSGAGASVDIWLLMATPFGPFSCDGAGPYSGWHFGAGNAFHTGPLASGSWTALDRTLPVGAYRVALAIETAPNGVLDWGSVYTHDLVDFDVLSAPRVYRWDDGSAEGILAWTSGGEMVWMNRFTAIPGGDTILDVRCIYGSLKYGGYSPPNGTQSEVYVWNDPTNDLDPADCVLLSSEPTTVQNVDTDIYNVVPLSRPATLSGEFYIGSRIPHKPGQFVFSGDMDTPYVPGSSWYCGTDTIGVFDPKYLTNNLYPPAENSFFFCLRAGY